MITDRELEGLAAGAVHRAMWWLSSRRGPVPPHPLEIERTDAIELVDTVRRVRRAETELPAESPTDRLGLIHFGDGVAVHVKQVWRIDPENPDAEPVLHNVRHEFRKDEATGAEYQETIDLGPAEPEKPQWRPLLVGLILKAKAATLAWQRAGKTEKDPASLDWPAPLAPILMNTLGCRAHPRHIVEDAGMLCKHHGAALPSWITEKVVHLVLARASFQSGSAWQLSELELIKLFRSPDHFARRIRELAESLVSSWTEHDERRVRPMSKRQATRTLVLLLEVADEVQGVKRTQQDRFKARLADLQAKPVRSNRDREVIAAYRLLGASRPTKPYRLPGDQPELKSQRLPGKQRLWANSQLRTEQYPSVAEKPPDSPAHTYGPHADPTPSFAGTPIPADAGAFLGADNATQAKPD